MSTTNADHFSLVASLVGFGIAICAILTQPVQVDSKRPTQTGNEEHRSTTEPAVARLWDDPFAVYPETDADEAGRLQPLLPGDGDTLILIVPTRTEQYEEDRENRIRTRYAIQRALIDQGFAAEPGDLLSSLTLPPPKELANADHLPEGNVGVLQVLLKQAESSGEGLRIPVQFFVQRPLQASLFKGSNASGFTSVAVIWLPDVYTCQRTVKSSPNQYLDLLVNVLRCSLSERRVLDAAANGSFKAQRRHDRWVFLGPCDSDGLEFYHQYPQFLSGGNGDVSIVPYRATIAQPVLEVLPGSTTDAGPILAESKSLPSVTPEPAPGHIQPVLDVLPGSITVAGPTPGEYEPIPTVTPGSTLRQSTPRRLGNTDDVLCAELLRAIHHAGSLPPHPQTIHVTVFAEWDTLYGRALAETFAALAAHGSSRPLDDPNFYPAMLEQLERGLLAHHPPLAIAAGGDRIKVTVIPYLRGLDGASSLYRANYAQPSTANDSTEKAGQESKARAANVVEAAEGTTQFDYIRRLTSESFSRRAPFWPQANRPDAVVIFGTDIYDKLVLLEFLRQELRNCLYLTTDLDALYWHPHYIRFTRGLIVASAFPLQMSAVLCGSSQLSNAICTPVEFRDSFQSAAYLVVTRCLQRSGQAFIEVPLDFTPQSLLYRVGNTKPLPVLSTSAGPPSDELPKSAVEAFLGGVGAWISGLLEPVEEGISPFWPFVLQLTVIGLGLYSLFYDVPRRMLLAHEVADEIWGAALALVPPRRRQSIAGLRETRIRPKWEKASLCRQPWDRTPPPQIGHAPVAGERNIEARVEKIDQHYTALLGKSVTKVEIMETVLCLLSDLFSLRPLRAEMSSMRGANEQRVTLFYLKKAVRSCLYALRRWIRQWLGEKDQGYACNQRFAIEMQPFVDYVRRDLTSPQPHFTDIQSNPQSLGRTWTLRCLRFIDRRFPDHRFILVGIVSIAMLAAICFQPVPFLVSPATLSYGWRLAFWMVSVTALIVTFCLFHRTCYEQNRFRKLVDALKTLVPHPDLGLSNRQLALVLTKASEPVANLTIVPCAMVFLIYASHLHALGGVPMADELFLLLGVPILAMLYAYAQLRGAALNAHAAVIDAYEKERADASRLLARLRSYSGGTHPLQDDESSLLDGLAQLIRKASTTPSNACRELAARIRQKSGRDQLCDYLESLIRRDETFVAQVGEMRTGVLAPLLTNPVTAALMIPIGGASGLTIIEWLVSNAR